MKAWYRICEEKTKQKKQSLWTRFCSEFSGCDTAGFVFFLETRLSKEQFRLLNHLISISIKIVMIFGSWLSCWKFCFYSNSEMFSNLQNFVLKVKVNYFSLILEVFVELLQLKSPQNILPKWNYDFSKLWYQHGFLS